jgi:hypothetical protein
VLLQQLPAGGAEALAGEAGEPVAGAARAFPPAAYAAPLLAKDSSTSGNWLGTYGGEGYSLFAFDGVDQRLESLPPYIQAVQQTYKEAINGPWPVADASDSRALQDPRNSSDRKLGAYCVPKFGQPSIVIDILLQPWAQGNTSYQLAVYVVDWDRRGRRQSLALLDGVSFAPISAPVIVEEFEEGVWLVWQYSGSARLRVNYIRGDNEVISAVAFDKVRR